MQFLVMELVAGETLAELIARGPIPIDEALALFKGIADGLEAAHGKGVVHRDLKQANVKISPDGTVTILEVGIAKALVGRRKSTSARSVGRSRIASGRSRRKGEPNRRGRGAAESCSIATATSLWPSRSQ